MCEKEVGKSMQFSSRYTIRYYIDSLENDTICDDIAKSDLILYRGPRSISYIYIN